MNPVNKYFLLTSKRFQIPDFSFCIPYISTSLNMKIFGAILVNTYILFKISETAALFLFYSL